MQNRTKRMLEIWEEEGGVIRKFDSLSMHLTDDYYKGCYEKLHVFRCQRYSSSFLLVSDTSTK